MLFRNEAWASKVRGKKEEAAILRASVVFYLVQNGRLCLSVPKSRL